MSMYGSVTDAQVFSRELSVEEMVDITSCRSTYDPQRTFLSLALLGAWDSELKIIIQVIPEGRHHPLGQGALEPEVTLEQILLRDAGCGKGHLRLKRPGILHGSPETLL